VDESAAELLRARLRERVVSFTGNSAAARLDRSGTVAVVTGQQAGLFGGWT